jgi:N-acetylmuramoyl-L-alanine amidase
MDGNRKTHLVCATLAGVMISFPLLGLLDASAQQTSAPPSAQAAPSPSPAPPSVPNSAGQGLPNLPVAPAHSAPRFLVVIDAAHGGNDSGARLSSQVLEKDLVLTLSVRLRSMLNAHGIPVVTIRESDVPISAINRAEAANHANAAACISLHATASGTGVHLFTSSLTPIPLTRFLPWDTAQGAYVAQSQRLSSEMDSSLTAAEIPVTLGRTALQPLDSFTCPAVAIEVAPLEHSGEKVAVTDSGYQNRIVSTLAAALEQWQKDWREQP